jgi:hypothetical protein
MSLPPGAERQKFVADYEHDRPIAYAQAANIETVLLSLDAKYPLAKKLWEENDLFKNFQTYKSLSNALLMSERAGFDARGIQRPVGLPDPLPDEATPSLEIVTTEYAEDIIVGKKNQFRVTVRCNKRFSDAWGTIEAKVRGGAATLDDPAEQSVQLTPGQTATLSWSFTATAVGQVKIGARVVPPVRY